MIRTNRIQSRSWFFFKNFLVRYLRYLFEKSMLVLTTILFPANQLELFIWLETERPSSPSRLSFTFSPRFPGLPSTLIRSWRKVSKAGPSKTPSLAGLEKSIVNLCLLEIFPAAAFGYKQIRERASVVSLLRRQLSKAIPDTNHLDGGEE